jgi:hypothetical protein
MKPISTNDVSSIRDPETEAILVQARQIISDRLPEKEVEFEVVFRQISDAASQVRGQLFFISLISYFRNLFGTNSTLEKCKLN